MKMQKIFIGNINKCNYHKKFYDFSKGLLVSEEEYDFIRKNYNIYTSNCCGYAYDFIPYSENEVLFKVAWNHYVRLKDINWLTYLAILMEEAPQSKSVFSHPKHIEDFFVDKTSLKPYFKEEKNITLKTLKRELNITCK